MKLSLWKRIKFFFIYRSLIKTNKLEIQQFKFQFDRHDIIQPSLRIDNVLRMYSVLTLPPETQTYMSGNIVKNHIQTYIRSVDKFLSSKGFSELVGIRDTKQIDETHYLIVFGYSHMDTAKVATRIVWILSILSFLTICIFLYFK